MLGQQRSTSAQGLCAQMLWDGVSCLSAGRAVCLSVEFAWRQLVPDFAALVRSVCVALEAWPQGMAKPKLFMTPDKPNLHVPPLGLQYQVRPSLHLLCTWAKAALLHAAGPQLEAPANRLMTQCGNPRCADLKPLAARASLCGAA